MPEYKLFDVSHQGTVTVLKLCSHDMMDHLLSNELQTAVVAFVEQERPQNLLVNFNDMRRFSSETINALLRARKRLAAYEGEMKLCGMRPEIRDVFRVMRLDGTVFEIYETFEQALAAFPA